MKTLKEIRKLGLSIIGLSIFASVIYSNNCEAQVATITVNNINTNVMTNAITKYYS